MNQSSLFFLNMNAWKWTKEAFTGFYSGAPAATLELKGWQRHTPSICSGRMPFFLAGFLKKNDSRGWSNVFKIGLHWSKKQKARINRQRSREDDREKEGASAGEGGETVLNNAVNYSESRARERRWNNTEQCLEPKLTRAIERRQKYPTNWLRRLQNSPSLKFPRSDAVQSRKKIQKSHDLVRWWTRGIKLAWLFRDITEQ